MRRPALKLALPTALTCLMAHVAFAATNPTPQTLPVSQNWGTTAFSNFSSFPGFVGWNGLSGSSITSQTSAQNSNPPTDATVSSGTPSDGGGGGLYGNAPAGNARLTILQSSNATNGVNQLAMAIDTTNKINIQLSYKLINVIVNPRSMGIVCQYRVGTSGAWTTLSGTNTVFTQSGAVGDVFNASATLPVDAENQPNVQIRWANWRPTSPGGNSSGEGIDDISVTGQAAGSTNPTASGTATPSPVCTGAVVTLSVTVTPGTGPVSSGIMVTADLTSIGGSNSAMLLDDGVPPDAMAGDNIFTLAPTVAIVPAGAKTIPVSVIDAQSRTASTNLNFDVMACGPTLPSATGTATPSAGCPSDPVVLSVTVTPGTNPTSSGITVTADLTNIGGSNAAAMLDDGVPPDSMAGDNIFTLSTTLGAVAPGLKSISVTIADAQSRMITTNISATVNFCGGAAPIVLSQVYGGGGNSGATLKNDFIELKNRTGSPASLSGWSVQYTSSAGSTWQVTPLTGTIPANGYYLVSEAQGAGGSVDLPTADAIGGIAMAAASGKVALVQSTTALTGGCPSGGNLIDLIGYGAADCFEGSTAAPLLSNSIAALRNNSGCTDTDQNGDDLVAAAPTPRNSSSPTHDCVTGPGPTGTGEATPSAQCRGQDVVLTVTVTPAQSPISTGITVHADMASIGLGTATALVDNGVPPDAVAGDNIFTGTGHLDNDALLGLRNIPVTLMDAEGRMGNTSIGLTVNDCSLRGTINVTPPGVCNGESALFAVTVSPANAPPSTGITVTLDLSDIAFSTAVPLNDTGTNGDAVAGDNVYSKQVLIPVGTPVGSSHFLVFTVRDNEGRLWEDLFSIANVDCMDSVSNVVISQVYGGGGNSGATLKNDFVELYNRSDSPVDLSTWSVQYASATGSSWTATPLIGTIAAHGYYLVEEGLGAGGTVDLPTPDASGNIAMSATAGKIALVSDVTPLTGTCPSGSPVVDFVGYGSTANCKEGIGQAATLTNTTANLRGNGGCKDTDNNVIDFATGNPTPRNSASPIHLCNVMACPTITGNMNYPVDNVVDGQDVAGFVQCLLGTPTANCTCGDYDHSGGVDMADVPMFVNVLLQ